MDNYFFSDEMLSDSFGTYNAAAMRIKITKTADSKPINHQKFSLLSNFDCTTLFHEYIHHLQNTSTITGIQHLDLLVSMWQNTRNYIDKENDIGSYERSKSAFIKSFEYNDNNKSILNRKEEFLIHSFNDLSATFGFFLNSAPPPENILQPASITCMQGENKIIVKFGIYEFQEGCAHLMEKVLCEKTQLEADKYNADLIPYKIIFHIRDHLFSKCTNENLIAIMLAAMQHAAPHKLFIFLLTLFGYKNEEKCQCEEKCHCSSQSTIRNECEDYARQLIEQNESWIESCKKSIYEGFKLDDPFLGNIIKNIIDNIGKKTITRKEKPFIELDFLQTVTSENFRDKLEQLIIDNGGCGYYVEDNISYPKKNLTWVIIEGTEPFLLDSKEWLTFQAAMNYTRRHYRGIDISSIKITMPNLNFPCPLQKVCNHSFNRDDSDCFECSPAKLPVAKIGIENCPYQLAVFKTSLSNHIPLMKE